MTFELMMQGTRRQSARQLADEIESIGASLGIQVTEDYTDIGCVAPAAQLDRVLRVLTDILVEPVFPPTEIKKERENILASLHSRQDSLFNMAYDAFNAQLFGGHPYGRPIEGLAPSIRRFHRKDFQEWHRNHLHPDQAIFSMVASWPPAAARRLVERHLRRWKKRGEFISDPSALAPRSIAKRVRIGARFEQAYLMTGVRAPSIMDPDYVNLKVLNTLLGGGMSSRLFLRLREELGLAYEVSSFYPTHLLASQWVIYLGLPPAKLALAKMELEKLLDTLQQSGPSADEVRQAVAMIKGSYLMEHQTRRRQAWYAGWWEFLGKGPEGDSRFLKALDHVTPGLLRTLARRLLAQPRVTVEVTPK